jgi:hypothetical protein
VRAVQLRCGCCVYLVHTGRSRSPSLRRCARWLDCGCLLPSQPWCPASADPGWTCRGGSWWTLFRRTMCANARTQPMCLPPTMYIALAAACKKCQCSRTAIHSRAHTHACIHAPIRATSMAPTCYTTPHTHNGVCCMQCRSGGLPPQMQRHRQASCRALALSSSLSPQMPLACPISWCVELAVSVATTAWGGGYVRLLERAVASEC